MREDNGNVGEPRQKRNSPSKLWKIALLVGGLLAGGLLAIVVAIRVLAGGEPDPNEMARQYIEGNIDKLGEDVAGFIVRDNWLLTELGGEYIESKVNDVVHWSYSPARLVSEGECLVTATAGVAFDVDSDVLGRTFMIEVALPFELTIRPGDETVSGRPDYAGGRVEHDIPAVPQLPSGREIKEKADEATDKAKDLLKNLSN